MEKKIILFFYIFCIIPGIYSNSHHTHVPKKDTVPHHVHLLLRIAPAKTLDVTQEIIVALDFYIQNNPSITSSSYTQKDLKKLKRNLTAFNKTAQKVYKYHARKISHHIIYEHEIIHNIHILIQALTWYIYHNDPAFSSLPLSTLKEQLENLDTALRKEKKRDIIISPKKFSSKKQKQRLKKKKTHLKKDVKVSAISNDNNDNDSIDLKNYTLTDYDTDFDGSVINDIPEQNNNADQEDPTLENDMINSYKDVTNKDGSIIGKYIRIRHEDDYCIGKFFTNDATEQDVVESNVHQPSLGNIVGYIHDTPNDIVLYAFDSDNQ